MAKTKEEYNKYMREYMRKYNARPENVHLHQSWKGRKYELIAARMLGATDMNKDVKCHRGWDLELNGMTIDVKSCNKTKLRKRRGGSTWKYYWKIDRRGLTADYVFLFCLNSDIPYKAYMIPVNEIESNHIRIYLNGKNYEKYLYKTF